MKRTSRHAPPALLQKRGLRTASEVAPMADFRIKNAGQTLAELFGRDLLPRLAALAAAKRKEQNA